MSFQILDGHSARSDELHRHILRSHLAYLNQEETPAKLQLRNNLENLIFDFLNAVSHNSKFAFVEISNILSASIENNYNFSAYKAASAFEALEKYATNLISHPWRKEYKTVKLYSGFYKHSVESQLLGGSFLFHLLGYQFTDKGVLFLDEPIDPDKVARVALDCLIAYVECQILLQICERMKSFKCSWLEIYQVRQDYVCGVDEAVRILHQLKRNVVEQEKQERWLREQENDSLRDDRTFHKPEPSTNYQKTGILVDVSNTWPSTSSFPGYNNSSGILQPTTANESRKSNKGALHTHSKLPSWSEGVSSQINDYHGHSYNSKFDEADNFSCQSFDSPMHSNYFLRKNSTLESKYTNSDITPDSWSDSWDVMQTPSSSHDRHDSYLNNCHDRIDYSTNVPNPKETCAPQFSHVYPSHPMLPLGLPAYALPHDFGVSPRQCPCRMCSDQHLPLLSHKFPVSRDVSSHAFEPYSRSVAKPESNHEDPTDICSSFLKLSVENANPSVKIKHFPLTSPFTPPYQTNSNPSNEVVLRSNGGSKLQQNNCKRDSYYDNVPSPFDTEINNSFGQSLPPKCDFHMNGMASSPTSTLPSTTKTQMTTSDASSNLHTKSTLKKSFSNGISGPKQVQSGIHASASSDPKSIKSHQTGLPKESKNDKKWSCLSCTFYNAPELTICDMCGRSRNPGPEIAPLVSGGKECPQCTLVNKKDSEDCVACGTSLKDSPTYI